LKNQLKFLGFEHVEKLFTGLCRGGPKGKREAKTELLIYFLRPIMMRHSQEQKYRGTSTTLMSLPPKVNHSVASQKVTLRRFCNVLSLTQSFLFWKINADGTERTDSIYRKREKKFEKTKKRHKIGISNFARLI
jgi:hypothetical protein